MTDVEPNLEDLEGLVGRVLDSRYVLEKFLDRGGYGAVYLGTDKKFNQPVAIKVGLSSREFMKEARLAAEVKHNHIVQVSDFGSDRGLAYLVMEYLQGDDLEKLFRKQNCRLTSDQLWKLVNEVGDALAHAHAEQLIHRDLKPRNIILREHYTKAGVATSNHKFVLLDFGIAAKLNAQGTERNRTQDGAGTVEYMAPELLSREPQATERSDIYAFGVILYQMITGQVPFPQSDASHLALANCLNSIITTSPQKFSEVMDGVNLPPGVEELVMQCLEKDPALRPQSMTELRRRFLDCYQHAVGVGGDSVSQRLAVFETSRPGSLVDTRFPGGSTVPANSLPVRSRFGNLLIVVACLIVGAVVFSLTNPFKGPSAAPYLSLTDEHGTLIEDGKPLVLTAGKNVTLTFAVNDLPRDASATFEAKSDSPLIKIEMLTGPIPGTSKNLLISIPDLNSNVAEPAPVKLVATDSLRGVRFERSVPLKIERPNAWLPPELEQLGFREATDSWRCLIGDKVFAAILDRPVKGKSVRFRLVPSTRIGDRTISTFYVMEHLVSNGLFNEFAKNHAGFELEPRKSSERRWELEQFANSPVTDLYAIEAQEFAWWLAGRTCGSLPSATEWELAAGYWDFVRLIDARLASDPNVRVDSLRNMRPTPTRIPGLDVDVWIGSGPSLCQFQNWNGELLKEHSPYGCDFTRLTDGKRPTELTRSLISDFFESSDLRTLCQNGIPKPDDPVMQKNFEVLLRGAGEKGDELTWLKDGDTRGVKTIKDLTEEATRLALFADAIGRVDFASFRVVVLTDPDSR